MTKASLSEDDRKIILASTIFLASIIRSTSSGKYRTPDFSDIVDQAELFYQSFDFSKKV